MNLQELVMNLIRQNPRIANNAQAQNMLSVIQSGDSVKGAEIAENLCNTYGVTKEEAIAKAKNFFHI